MNNKKVIATKIDFTHITIPCFQPKKCRRKEHLYGSCGELHNRIENRCSHCYDGENIDIIIDKSTKRPFWNTKSL